MRLLGLLRTLHARPRNGRWRFVAQFDRQGNGIGETPLRSPTVFNFFEPGYRLPRRDRRRRPGVAGIPDRHRDDGDRRRQPPVEHPRRRPATTDRSIVDLRPFRAAAGAGDGALLDEVDLLLFGGAMTDATRALLATALADPAFPRDADPRVLSLLWLASMTPEAVVQK